MGRARSSSLGCSAKDYQAHAAAGDMPAADMIGALIQGSIGYGLNLVVVPVAAVVQPSALPAAMIEGPSR